MSENTVNAGINMILCKRMSTFVSQIFGSQAFKSADLVYIVFSNSLMASLNQRSNLRQLADKYAAKV